jgi:hypothetical protein
MDEFDRIIASALPDLEKLAQAFDWVTARVVAHAHQDIELAQAMQDQESVVKHQIKMETLKYARSVFNDCYRRVSGRRAWDE